MKVQLVPFLDVFKDASGGNIKTPQSEFLEEGDIPVVDQGHRLVAGYVMNRSRICRASPPVIVFGDHTRAIKYVDFDFAMGADGTKVLVPRSGNHPKYLYHALKAIQIPSAGYSRHYKFLKEMSIPLPPLVEQKRIAGILDAADALRAKRREALAQLDTLLQSTFLDMFGDPVTNPMGWEVVKFRNLGASRLGKMLDKGKQEGNCQFPYLANFNVQWAGFKLENLRKMDFDADDRVEFELRDGDLLICEGGEVGRTAIWRSQRKNVYFQKALHRVRLEPTKALPEFGQYFMWFMAKNGGFRDVTNSATISHLTGAKLKTLPVPLPPLALQRRFAAIVESVERQKTRMRAHLAELDALFASLQFRAFSGTL